MHVDAGVFGISHRRRLSSDISLEDKEGKKE